MKLDGLESNWHWTWPESELAGVSMQISEGRCSCHTDLALHLTAGELPDLIGHDLILTGPTGESHRSLD